MPNWVLEKFAVILVAPITTILNCSFREGRLPRVWKLANICPIPKGDQVLDVNKDLRPISLTSTLCKIAEEVIISSHLKPLLLACMDFNQFGFVPGSCTTFALISLIHRWSEVLDKSDSSVRTVLLDYRKAFDMIDHNILYEKLQGIGVIPLVLKWILDFLYDRFQRAKLNSNCFSNWEPVCAGVPQGTKLGPWLFLLMINDLSIPAGLIQGDMFKYADDTEISEYILGSACSSNMQYVTNSIITWSQQNKFELNPLKCKEIMVNFSREQPDYPPILVNGTIIERVKKAEILGLVITDDLKWNEHVNKITIKAARRLYLLKQLKKSGLDINDLKCFYVAPIRSILEYACQVFHYGLPQYLSDAIERIQRRALRIIHPDISYQAALDKLNMVTLWERREKLCTELFNSVVNDENHKLHNLLPPKTVNIHNLRKAKKFYIPNFRTNRFRNTFIISSLLKD